jgi:hypothetical protein
MSKILDSEFVDVDFEAGKIKLVAEYPVVQVAKPILDQVFAYIDELAAKTEFTSIDDAAAKALRAAVYAKLGL